MPFLSMLSPNILKYGLVALIVLGVLWKIHDLSSEVKERDLVIKVLENNLDTCNTKSNIVTNNNERLLKSINTLNTAVEQLQSNRETMLKDYNRVLQQSNTERVKNRELKKLLEDAKDRNTCEYGLELNKAISNMKYEDM